MKRIILWKAGLEMIQDYPIMGVGLRNFKLVFPQYNSHIYAQTPHSLYFELSCDTGLLGLFIFLSLIMSSVRSLRQILKNIPKKSEMGFVCLAMEAGFIGFLVSHIFGAGLYFEPLYYVIMTGPIIKRLIKEGSIV